MRLHDLLTEVISTKYDLEKDAEFVVDQKDHLQIKADIGGRTIEFEAERKGGFWTIGFYELKDDGEQVWTLTGSGSAPKVLSFASECIRLLVNEKSPKEMHFVVDSKDRSRAGVYKKMFEREKSDKYDLVIDDSSGSTYFKLVRK